MTNEQQAAGDTTSPQEECPADRLVKLLKVELTELEKLGYVCHLKEHRKRRKLVLKQVAESVGTTFGHLSQLEVGQSMPSLPMAMRLARFYGATVDELWRYKGNMTTTPQTEAK